VYTNNDITSSFHTYLFLRSILERYILEALPHRVLYCGHSTQYSHLVIFVVICSISLSVDAFSVLMLLVEWQEGHPA